MRGPTTTEEVFSSSKLYVNTEWVCVCLVRLLKNFSRSDRRNDELSFLSVTQSYLSTLCPDSSCKSTLFKLQD